MKRKSAKNDSPATQNPRTDTPAELEMSTAFGHGNRWIILLIGVLLFALLVRVVRLNTPDERYFDEVYHAYTAEQWAKGNTDAWDFATKAPDKGNAYEWTHPPLAKLIMMWSIELFGDVPWTWRLPAALLGVVCIGLVFAIGVRVFHDERVALVAATLMSLDALPLFCSRIGMNDVYCVTFILAGVYAALRRRIFICAICIGLAGACKWTTAYALPLIALILILETPRQVFWRQAGIAVIAFATIVPAIYMASYIPFFQAGYSLEYWWELQKQIYWYHTKLPATHSFASAAWMWPFCGGGLWAHTSSNDAAKTTVNIWAMGNPVIWWAGVSAVLFAAYRVITTGDRRHTYILAGYLAFWAPWLLSPRIMFIYHYFPSLPFLYLLLAYQLTQMGRRWMIGYLVAAGIAFVIQYPFVTAIEMPQSWNIATWF